ncbi:phosphoribosylamine--glycine ligase [Enterococcus caccae]|uniref:Phosphoribosylamine--glycine ligase n=1 Tax=Enterococcus caccae ATCC BAA-1240 TaxID=1158612 RepID=R3W6I8_9ENTE|nr:phosphoribosylamine--glycine ligase [Enterococcus caccae]EOL43311.1 phosphoribosylamine-glycine ligase [Enterococcus caccae ATCC BAA-1240]EOT68289.1 phosphoribosylamine-glycine ligase [Enterococcus caccae ATCC BAA-1240]OJG26776.1 phosphoribosylamine-glycine ligase [Enterococcus caccae]
MGLTILVIGSGGREHVIAQKLIQSPKVTTVFCARGNVGMKKDGIQLIDIAEDDHDALIRFAKEQSVDWTFVGPEIPLLNGIVDDFTAAGLKAFGPLKAAALIEGSKDFAKQMMNKYNIPTADHQTFFDFAKARAYVVEKGAPIVIKADGLAAGKGVVVAETVEEAIDALREMLEENKFGSSGAKVVIEEFLVGEEFSLLAFVRDEEVYPMVIAQDHKRAYENDLGPNTGGMGAYSPVPQIANELVDEAIETILKPTAQGMIAEGKAFSGILYAGLIATETGPKVIEFNARFGDPETQVVLQRLESDLAQVIDDLLNGMQPDIKWKQKGYSLGVVVAANGYPNRYENDCLIPDFSNVESEQIYYAGVKEENGQLVSNGGRIYLVEASSDTLLQAQEAVYTLLNTVETKGTFYRKDIGFRGIEREK